MTTKPTDPRWIDEHGDEIDEDHRGLVYDIRTLVDRRRALGIFGGVGLDGTARRLLRRRPRGRRRARRGSRVDHATATPRRAPSAAASGPLTRCPTRPADPTRATGRTA